jgi:NADH-quinone oxidoreductase subunit J
MTTMDTERKPMTVGEWMGAATMLLAVYVLVGLYWADSHASLIDAFGIDKLPEGSHQLTADVSDSIFSTYLVPFDVVSVLLLAALVGAIVLARKE